VGQVPVVCEILFCRKDYGAVLAFESVLRGLVFRENFWTAECSLACGTCDGMSNGMVFL
jgi:hypothetical protein